MFLNNNFQRISIFDRFKNLPQYQKDMLLNSWAHKFQEIIFPAINENRFSVLYSDKASRPNSPVNVIIGALILKEIFQLSDAQLLESIFFDERFQYALRLTSKDRPPVSYNTFTNFRNRNYTHERSTGIDLIKEEVESLAQLIAEHLNIDGKKVRMDSFMVASSCKNLSRIELVYTVNYQFVKMLSKSYNELIPEDCRCYLEKGNKNDTIYRTKDNESETKLELLLKQSKSLYDTGVDAGKKVTESDEFKTLKRMLGEQTKDDNNFDVIEPKDNKNVSPDSLQNPSDPDATYRKKYGDNVGYTANVTESFDEDNSVITSYDLQPNTYSDEQFSEDTIEKLGNNNADEQNNENHTLNTENKNQQKSNCTTLNIDENLIHASENKDNNGLIQIFIDGAYYSFALARKAISMGILLIPGELTGRKPAKDKMGYNQFEIDEQIQEVTECANGKKPVESNFNEETDTYTAKFDKNDCSNCPFSSSCRIQEQVKFNSVRFTEQRYATDKLRELMKTDEYIKLTNQRAAIEGVPSVFRRKYNVDHMPVRGLVRSKFWFGLKVAASNVKKLFKGLKLAGI